MTFFTAGTSPCRAVRQPFLPAIPFYLKFLWTTSLLRRMKARKPDLIFTSSTNRVMPVVVFKRPFFFFLHDELMDSLSPL